MIAKKGFDGEPVRVMVACYNPPSDIAMGVNSFKEAKDGAMDNGDGD